MIRKATPDDFTAMMGFIGMMHSHVVLPISSQAVGNVVAATIESGEAYVAEVDGEVIGTIGYCVAAPWYTEQCAVFDKWMCVKEGHQGGMLAGRLIRTLEKIADDLGLPFLPGLSGDMVNEKVFDGRYKKVGVMYKRDAK